MLKTAWVERAEKRVSTQGQMRRGQRHRQGGFEPSICSRSFAGQNHRSKEG